MCDCAELLRRRRPPPPDGYSAKTVIALSVLSAGLLGWMFYYDRRSLKRLLAIFGLGWLISCPCGRKAPSCPPPPCPPPPCPPPPCPPPSCPPKRCTSCPPSPCCPKP